MTDSEQSSKDRIFMNRALEATIRIGLVVMLAAWCFEIVRPFIVPVVWGIIIAIAFNPGYHRLQSILGGRRRLAATLFILLALVVLITPAVVLTGTLVDAAKHIARELADGAVTIPPPPQSIAMWPVVGDPLDEFWSRASVNLGEALNEVKPQLKTFGRWLLSIAAGAGLGILQFTAAIIIAGVLLPRAGAGHHAARAIATRLAGGRGTDFADLAEATVRSVTRGILGVALIQSLLAGLGFLAAGVPAAGLWALLCLFLSVVQIGIVIILIPIVIWVFSNSDMGTAIAFLIWSIFVGVIDNVLKPILLGRGVEVPMLVIFIGAIGGFLAMGIIGLFVGSVILTLAYKLFLAWLGEAPEPLRQRNTHEAPPIAADASEGRRTSQKKPRARRGAK
jgi:predicted PurR-regulated permease PerM